MKKRYLIKKSMKTLIRLISFMILLVLVLQVTSRAQDIEAKKINTDKVHDTVKKTEIITTFDWIQDVNPSIGSITIEEDGRKVNMTGNRTNPGKNAIYIIPENHQEQNLKFDYDVDYGDSFNAAGILLKIREQNGYLEGYLLSFNNPNAYSDWYTGSENKLGAIWTIRYQLRTNASDYVEKSLVKALDIPQKGTISVKSTEGQIVLTGENINEKIDTSSNTATGDGFGFFTNHYSHSCNQIGHFALTNFGLQTVDLIPHNFIVDPNGGIWKGSSEISEIEGIYQDTVDVPVPTREGYTFVKWTQIGNSGTMSSLTEDAVYTFGENEEIDDKIIAEWIRIVGKKETNIQNSEVKVDDVVTYIITLRNEGTVDGRAIINDDAPEGTQFVENSIKINDEVTDYTLEELKNGIQIDVPVGGETRLSFDVKVNDLENDAIISNKANYKDVTVTGKETDGETNRLDLTYIEPIISSRKEATTENGNEYVVENEKIEYKIIVQNDGGLEKDVIIQDIVPEGTTFVEGSIKINDEQTQYTKEDLKNGIQVNVPKKIKTIDNLENASNMIEMVNMRVLDSNLLSGTTVLTFEVTANDQENEDVITNIAKVDNKDTNEVNFTYLEPIISSKKEATTENGKDYVVTDEAIEYKIIVQNDGGVAKDVVIKDIVPEGTTFVEGSIKINDERTQYTKEDLKNGIKVNVPKKIKEDANFVSDSNVTDVPDTESLIGETILTFKVTSNNQKDENIIKNIAKVDNEDTNEIDYIYRKPIISAKKEMKTENDLEYAVSKENIKYSIIVKNTGSIAKNVIVKDEIPEGTTFINGSIEIDGEKTDYTEKDLQKGIEVEIPKKQPKEEQENTADDKEEEGEKTEDTTNNKEGQREEETEKNTNQENSNNIEVSENLNELNLREDVDNLERNLDVVGESNEDNSLSESNSEANENKDNNIQNDNEENNNDENQDATDEVEEDENQNLQEDEEPGEVIITFNIIVDDLKDDKKTRIIENIAEVDSKKTNKTSIEVLPFNLNIETEVESFNINGSIKQNSNPKLAKTDIDMRRSSPIPNVIANIKIKVTNTGKIKGSSMIEATIPDGFTLANSQWKSSGTNTARIETKEIKPGETQELSLDVKWNNSETNLGQRSTKAEIIETNNEARAAETTIEDNESDADMIIGVVTGEYDNIIILSIIGIISLLAIIIEIIVIKKYVL